MRALMLALATVSSLAAGAATLAQTLTVNPNLSIDVTGFSGEPKVLPDAVSNIESLNRGRVAAIAYNNVAGTPGYGVILGDRTSRFGGSTSRPARVFLLPAHRFRRGC